MHFFKKNFNTGKKNCFFAARPSRARVRVLFIFIFIGPISRPISEISKMSNGDINANRRSATLTKCNPGGNLASVWLLQAWPDRKSRRPPKILVCSYAKLLNFFS